jgi:hypothetical protein
MLEKIFALKLVSQNLKIFRADFLGWLDANFHIWQEFERRANQVWDSGRRHYSVRTIIGVVRFETDMREVGSQFKINNNFTPDLARLYGLAYPNRIFEKRVIIGLSTRAA